MKPGDRVEVFWSDTASNDEWKDADEPVQELIRCSTLGYYIGMDKEGVYLVSTVTDDNCRFGEVTIPRGCVKRIAKI